VARPSACLSPFREGQGTGGGGRGGGGGEGGGGSGSGAELRRTAVNDF